jgi:hypothetical protein
MQDALWMAGRYAGCFMDDWKICSMLYMR